VIRRLADRLAARACAVIDVQRKATVVDLTVVNAAGLLYRLADWRSR
jgi:hypothetical protein